MRIAHINWSLGTGGIENMVSEIVSEQSKTDDVALFIINDLVEDYILNKIDKRVHLYLIGRKPGSRNPFPLFKFNLLLAKFHPDIIHCHATGEINLVFCPFGKRVRTIHGTFNPCREYPKFDRLIAISKAVKEFTANQGFDSVEIDNGISTSYITHTPSGMFNDGKYHFIQVSRLKTKQKGQDILINALSILKDKYQKTNFHMHFIGDGEDKDKLVDLTKSKGLKDYITFEGRVEQQKIYKQLCEYDLFIQPSRIEGFGLTVAEAIAAKVPVLVSNIEGPLEIIDGGKYGKTFKSEDAEDCAKKLNEFMEQGKNDALIEDAYKHVVNNYDVSVTAEKYLEVYRSLLNSKSE